MANDTLTSRKWYIAEVRPKTELAVRDLLLKKGYEAYVASVKSVHRYANRTKRTVETVKIPFVVFVRANDEERDLILHFPNVKRFMVDKARQLKKIGNAVHPFSTLTDLQIQKLRQGIEGGEVTEFLIG